MTRPLRVLHLGPYPYYGQASGVDAAAWSMLSAQVAAGLDVWLMTLRGLTPAAHAEAARVGISLETAKLQPFQTLSHDGAAAVRRIGPNVVHFHSVFIPGHAQVARILDQLDIPYILSPHGGLNLWRGQLKKTIYAALVEKNHFSKARAIFVLTEREQEVVDSWLGGRRKPQRYLVLPNPIPPLPADTELWRLPNRPRLVYLGRFDVLKKGLDRLVAIARLLPNVQVSAYGIADRKTEQKNFAALCQSGLPDNIRFHGPVYNEEKIAALAAATIYVQLSRDEGFGMAIVEAMRQGVPVAITRGCDIANIVAEQDLGLILPDDPADAAAVLASTLTDSALLNRWSEAGREWTLQALSPKHAAAEIIAVYETAIARAGGLSYIHARDYSSSHQGHDRISVG